MGQLVNALQSFMCYVNIAADLQYFLSKIITNFAFSETMFKEYVEKFKKINLKGKESHIQQINQAIWLLYIVSKSKQSQ